MPGSHRASTPLHASLPEAHADDADLPAQHPALADQPNQVTLSLRSGDAVLLDYRLLHGTHPNMATERRDAVLLSFAPSWRELPKDVQAHLIQHPALPTQDEDGASDRRVRTTIASVLRRARGSRHQPESTRDIHRQPLMSTVDTSAPGVPRAQRYACSACKGSDLPSSSRERSGSSVTSREVTRHETARRNVFCRSRPHENVACSTLAIGRQEACPCWD